jgi:hypothetical protein
MSQYQIVFKSSNKNPPKQKGIGIQWLETDPLWMQLMQPTKHWHMHVTRFEWHVKMQISMEELQELHKDKLRN